MWNESIENLIPIINNLHDISSSVGEALDFDLPLIAVVGSQSAGKSSVLEKFVGRDFLPRGSGIVTRRPLILKLIHNPNEEYGIFLHKGSKKYFSFQEISQEIIDETERTVPGKQVSPSPINLTVLSPNVMNLTLVDLPGLTKIAVGGQDKNISKTIRKMVLSFINKPNSLILAVSPANVDLANSDALNIAHEADPSGSRTIGVITKLDLMDQGTDALEILNNKVIPLRRGYIGIVNRSQKDIDGNKDIKDADQSEREYFLKHPKYRAIANRCGTNYLQKTLAEQLTNHIRLVLPKLREKITKRNINLKNELDTLEMSAMSNINVRARFIVSSIQQFTDIFASIIYGIRNREMERLLCGYNIERLLTQRLGYELRNVALNKKFLSDRVAIAIKNSAGIRVDIFLSSAVLEELIRSIIKRLIQPVHFVIEKILNEQKNCVHETAETVINITSFQLYVKDLILNKLNKNVSNLKDFIDVLIEAECGHIYTRSNKFTLKNATNEVTSDDEDGVSDLNEKNVKRGPARIKYSAYFAKNDYWFVLTSQQLAVYKKPNMANLKFSIDTKDLVINAEDISKIKEKHLHLSRVDQKKIYKDAKFLIMTMSPDNYDEDIEDWKAAFMSAGAALDEIDRISDIDNNDMETSVNKDEMDKILTIKKLVRFYMDVTLDNLTDIIPKVIIEFMVTRLFKYLRSDLIAIIFSNENLDEFFNESPLEKLKREETRKIYDATKEALKHINEIVSNTRQTNIPPPLQIKEDKKNKHKKIK